MKLEVKFFHVSKPEVTLNLELKSGIAEHNTNSLGSCANIECRRIC
jgi:hypothetical protein